MESFAVRKKCYLVTRSIIPSVSFTEMLWFHNVFYPCDGKPSCPEHWLSSIGNQIKKACSELPVVTLIFLSWMKKKRNICLVSRNNSIKCLKELLHILLMMIVIEPAQLCVSKWNTLYSSILRLYVATWRPSYELKWIVIKIIKSSAAMWFYVKMKPYLTYSSRNVFQSLLYMKNMNSKKTTIVKKTVERYQLLLGMCADEIVTIRKNLTLW